MSTPLLPAAQPLSAWQRWKIGLRIFLTVGIGIALSWFAIGVLGGFTMLLVGLVVPPESVAALWISRVVAGVFVLVVFPLLMYNWCSIWGLPQMDSIVDAQLLKKKQQRARPQG